MCWRSPSRKLPGLRAFRPHAGINSRSQVRRLRQLVESSSFAENAPLRIDCKAKPPKREDTHYALVEWLLPSDSISAFLGQRTSKGESIRYWSVLDLNSFFR